MTFVHCCVLKQSKKRNIQPPKTKIECHMAACVSEVDISIVDRINCLLNPQEFNGSGSQSLSHVSFLLLINIEFVEYSSCESSS